MSASFSRLRWTLLIVPLLLVAFVACETASISTSTSTPVPTPTATPIPALSPITLDAVEDPRWVLQLMPQEEHQC